MAKPSQYNTIFLTAFIREIWLILLVAGKIQWINDSYSEGCTFTGAIGEKLGDLTASRQDCDLKCAENPKCTHYNWVEGDTCILRTGLAHKSGATRTTEQTNTCGIKLIKWEKGNWALACSFPTKSYLQELRTEPNKCGPTCAAKNDCTHFNFIPENETCRLMTGAIRKDQAYITPNPLMVCGVTLVDYVDWQIDNWADRCEFKGKTFAEVSTAVNACGPECEKSPKCTHFTWIKGTCHLKEGKFNKEDAVYTGVKDNICGFVRNGQK